VVAVIISGGGSRLDGGGGEAAQGKRAGDLQLAQVLWRNSGKRCAAPAVAQGGRVRGRSSSCEARPRHVMWEVPAKRWPCRPPGAMRRMAWQKVHLSAQRGWRCSSWCDRR
jgi:hypothetical protein